MGIKSRLIEFIVRNDLVPVKMRWRKSASGVGRLFNDVYHMLSAEDRRKLASLLYEWGLNDAEEVVNTLKIKRSAWVCNRDFNGKQRLRHKKQDSNGEKR